MFYLGHYKYFVWWWWWWWWIINKSHWNLSTKLVSC